MSEAYLIPVRDSDGAAITGKAKSDFSLTYYVDGADTATTAITVAEVGSSGDYLVTVPDPADDEDHVLVVEDAGTLGVATGWMYSIEWPSRIRNSELVDDIWAATTRTLSSFGTLAADVWSYATRTVTSGAVSFSGPTDSTGNITLVRGDSYSADDSRQLAWSSTGWPNLTSATIKLSVRNKKTDALEMDVTGAVVTAGASGTQTVKAEPTSTNTNIPAGSYNFDVQATLSSGNIVTLKRGTCTIQEHYTR